MRGLLEEPTEGTALTLTTTGSSGASTYDSITGTLNIPIYSGGGSGTVTDVSSANADIGVATGTTTPVLTLNSATLPTASTIVKRDASANTYSNNYFANTASTVSVGGTTTLTVASARTQNLTGSSNQTFQLPDATTLALSSIFEFNNNSSGSLTITNAGAVSQYVVPAGGAVICYCTSIGSANGTWDFHALAPAVTTWVSGVTGLIMNSVLTTSPRIGSGASSSTAPSFIPQRGASTTGFGGDGTDLHATIAGTARLTISATGITATNLSGTNTGDQDLSGLVPYTGATADLDLGAHKLITKEITTPIGLGDNLSIIADDGITADAQSIILRGTTSFGISNNGGSSIARFDTNTQTTDRLYTLPDADGTFVLSVNGNTPDTSGNVTISSGGLTQPQIMARLSIGF